MTPNYKINIYDCANGYKIGLVKINKLDKDKCLSKKNQR